MFNHAWKSPMPTHLWYEEYQSEFIDEWYMEKCVSASSKSVLSNVHKRKITSLLRIHLKATTSWQWVWSYMCKEWLSGEKGDSNVCWEDGCLASVRGRVHVTRVQPLVRDYLFLPFQMIFRSCGNIVGTFHASPPRHPETPTKVLPQATTYLAV